MSQNLTASNGVIHLAADVLPEWDVGTDPTTVSNPLLVPTEAPPPFPDQFFSIFDIPQVPDISGLYQTPEMDSSGSISSSSDSSSDEDLEALKIPYSDGPSCEEKIYKTSIGKTAIPSTGDRAHEPNFEQGSENVRGNEKNQGTASRYDQTPGGWRRYSEPGKEPRWHDEDLENDKSPGKWQGDTKPSPADHQLPRPQDQRLLEFLTMLDETEVERNGGVTLSPQPRGSSEFSGSSVLFPATLHLPGSQFSGSSRFPSSPQLLTQLQLRSGDIFSVHMTPWAGQQHHASNTEENTILGRPQFSSDHNQPSAGESSPLKEHPCSHNHIHHPEGTPRHHNDSGKEGKHWECTLDFACLF